MRFIKKVSSFLTLQYWKIIELCIPYLDKNPEEHLVLVQNNIGLSPINEILISYFE